MRYKSLKYIVLLCIVLAACKNRQPGNKQPPEADSIQTIESTPLHDLQQNNPAFSNWTNYYHIDISDSFVESSSPSDIYTYPNEVSLSDYELYKPLLVYNNDSSRFIDAYSYWLILDRDKSGQLTARGGEPDVEVAVVDVKSKKRKRIFFCGTTCMVQKAFWLGNDVVAVAGMNSENADEQYTPVIWFVNTINGSTTRYDYQKTISGEDARAYFKREMESKGVMPED